MKYKTITTINNKNLTPIGFIRVSGFGQTFDDQKSIIKRLNPSIKVFLKSKEKGYSLPHKRLSKLLPKSLIYASHPDRYLKSNKVSAVKNLNKILVTKKSKAYIDCLYLKKIEKLMTVLNEQDYMASVKQRLMEPVNSGANPSPLTSYEENLCKSVFIELQAIESELYDPDLKFWGISSFIGYGVNQVLSARNNTARELLDNNTGNRSRHLLLFSALRKYQSKNPTMTLKELGKKLMRNRGLKTSNNKRYSDSALSQVLNSDQYEDYLKHCNKITKSLKWFDRTPKLLPTPGIIPKSKSIKRAMKTLGYKKLHKEQFQTVNSLLRGESVALNTRTGGGKSQIPLLYSLMKPHELVLVVLPTIAVIQNLYDNWKPVLGPNNLKFLNSDNNKQKPKLLNMIIRGEISILLTTPNQLDSYGFSKAVKKRKILLMIDEVHNLAYSGLTYRPEYKVGKFKKFINETKIERLLMTSATIEKETMKQIKIMGDFNVLRGSLRRPNLKLVTINLGNRGQKILTLHHLITELKERRLDKGIVYFSTIENLLFVKKIFDELWPKNKPLTYYRGRKNQMTNAERKADLRSFSNNKRALIFATCAFGEGLDFNNVRFVVCFDCAGSIAELYQWIGRAGRDNEQALAFQFIDPHGSALRNYLIKAPNNNSNGKQFQKERFAELQNLLKQYPNPNIKNLIKHLTP